MPKEELVEEIVLVKVNIDKLDVAVLGHILAAEQPLQRLDLIPRVIVRIRVAEGDDGLLVGRIGIGGYLGVAELVQEVPVSRDHRDLVQEHGCLLEEGHVPVRRAQQDDPAPLKLLGDLLRTLEGPFVELGFQELDRVPKLGLVRGFCDSQLVEQVEEYRE